MNPNKNDNQQILSQEQQSSRRIIQPINEDEVKSYIKENASDYNRLQDLDIQDKNINNLSVENKINVPTQQIYPSIEAKPVEQNYDDWQPKGTLSSRVTQLRIYGILLVIIPLIIMYVSRFIWMISNSITARIIAILIYSFLVTMIFSGLVLLFSKSKILVTASLNILIGVTLLITLGSILSLNFVGLIFNLFVIGAVINLKRYVRNAA